MLQRALFSLLLVAWVGCMEDLQVGDAHDAGPNADGDAHDAGLIADGGGSVDDLLDEYSEQIAGAWTLVDGPDDAVITLKPDPDPARPRSGTFAVCWGCPPPGGPPKPPGPALWTGTYNLFAIENALAYGTVYPKPGQLPLIPDTFSALLKYDPSREKITWFSREWTLAP